MSDFPFETKILDDKNLDLLENFTCGHDELDRYVKEDAFKDNSIGKGVTYLVVDKRNAKLVAYYTLSSTSLLFFDDKDISNKKSIDEVVIRGIPSIEIKMFAVRKSFQDVFYKDEENQQILVSDVILGAVIGDIYNIVTSTLGARMIVLNSVPDAVKFYERNCFLPLGEYISLYDEYSKDCVPMYMMLFDYD